MATHYTIKVNLNRVIKIGIFNNNNTKYKLATVYKTLQNTYPNKEIYVANAGFFSMSSPWFPIFGIKADGKEIASDWTQDCFIAMSGNKLVYGKKGEIPNSLYTDAITGHPSLLEEGVKSSSFSYCIDNTNRGRTMLGFNSNEVILSCIGDIAGNSDFTLDEEIEFMKNQGCKYAINLDGGGSSQCNFNGNTIVSSRTVNNFIYIIVEPDKSKKVVDEDGLWGKGTTQYTQKILGTVADGIISGQLPSCKKYLPNCMVSSWEFKNGGKGSSCIKALQKLIGTTADGYFGQGSVKALQLFLKKSGQYTGSISGLLNNDTAKAWQKYINNYFSK